MRAVLVVLAMAALAGCAQLGEQEAASAARNACANAPDPAQCVRDSRDRQARAEDREVRRQIQHRTKRDDERVHYPDDDDWSTH
ncbi:MAG: hypothetical protein ABUS57_04570 [Pseudomonadota bacterium]